MIGAAAVIWIAYWYYRTADALGLPGLPWTLAGIIVYYGTFAAWLNLLLRPVLGDAFRTHGMWLGLAMDVSAVLAGLATAWWFRRSVLLRKGRTVASG
ncbi:MAG: hypothetical protein U1E83_00730 [Methylotetracoccus sp.]